ncbi:unnamed protein product [Closterium sp. NIES-65]|nr:unnamed protein product [Closterium sp. NIES-65]
MTTHVRIRSALGNAAVANPAVFPLSRSIALIVLITVAAIFGVCSAPPPISASNAPERPSASPRLRRSLRPRLPSAVHAEFSAPLTAAQAAPCGAAAAATTRRATLSGGDFRRDESQDALRRRRRLGGKVAGWNLSLGQYALATNRTRRRDPLNGMRVYEGGYDPANLHYWASLSVTAGFGPSLGVTAGPPLSTSLYPRRLDRGGFAVMLAGAILLQKSMGVVRDGAVERVGAVVNTVYNVSQAMAGLTEVDVGGNQMPDRAGVLRRAQEAWSIADGMQSSFNGARDTADRAIKYMFMTMFAMGAVITALGALGVGECSLLPFKCSLLPVTPHPPVVPLATSMPLLFRRPNLPSPSLSGFPKALSMLLHQHHHCPSVSLLPTVPVCSPCVDQAASSPSCGSWQSSLGDSPHLALESTQKSSLSLCLLPLLLLARAASSPSCGSWQSLEGDTAVAANEILHDASLQKQVLGSLPCSAQRSLASVRVSILAASAQATSLVNTTVASTYPQVLQQMPGGPYSAVCVPYAPAPSYTPTTCPSTAIDLQSFAANLYGPASSGMAVGVVEDIAAVSMGIAALNGSLAAMGAAANCSYVLDSLHYAMDQGDRIELDLQLLWIGFLILSVACMLLALCIPVYVYRAVRLGHEPEKKGDAADPDSLYKAGVSNPPVPAAAPYMAYSSGPSHGKMGCLPPEKPCSYDGSQASDTSSDTRHSYKSRTGCGNYDQRCMTGNCPYCPGYLGKF